MDLLLHFVFLFAAAQELLHVQSTAQSSPAGGQAPDIVKIGECMIYTCEMKRLAQDYSLIDRTYFVEREERHFMLCMIMMIINFSFHPFAVVVVMLLICCLFTFHFSRTPNSSTRIRTKTRIQTP